MKTASPLLLLSALLGIAFPAVAEVKREFKPAFLDADAGGRTVGARFNLSYDNRVDADRLGAHFSAATKGTVTAKKAANPENITTEIAASLARRLGGTVIVNPGQPPLDPSAPNPVVTDAPWEALMSADLKVGFETDQPFKHTNITFGPRLGFVQMERVGPRALVPSVHVSYDRVKVLESDFLQSIGVGARTFWRLEVAASWVWAPFENPSGATTTLSSLSLHADVRYFHSFDLPTPANALSQQENIYTAGTVRYGVRNRGWKYVDALYVTVAHGRLPPSTREDTTVFVGVFLFAK